MHFSDDQSSPTIAFAHRFQACEVVATNTTPSCLKDALSKKSAVMEPFEGHIEHM